MRCPTVKRMVRELNISTEQARTVRGLVKGSIDPESVEATADWVRQCYHRPSDDELIQHAVDVTLETFGTEALWGDSCTQPEYVYCNAGDTYAATMIWRWDGWGWSDPFIACWGDIAERNPNLR